LAAATLVGIAALVNADQLMIAVATSIVALLTGATTSLKAMYVDTQEALRAAEHILEVGTDEEIASVRRAEERGRGQRRFLKSTVVYDLPSWLGRLVSSGRRGTGCRIGWRSGC
jgi:hypothetical protein